MIQLSELVRCISEQIHIEWMIGMTKEEMGLPDICYTVEDHLQLIRILNDKDPVSDFFKSM